jgi:hypothetical protein
MMSPFRRNRWTGRVSLLLMAALLNGCFSYVPANGDAPTPGQRVRVYLQEPQDFRLTNVTANDVTLIRGEFAQEVEDGLALSAFLLTSQNGYENLARGETTLVPRTNIQALELSRLSAAKTAGLAAIVAGIGVLVSAAIASGFAGGSGPPGGGEEQ